MKRTVSSIVLMVLLMFLAIGAIPSGLTLVIDPTGKRIGFPPELLEQLQGSPFPDFLIPGAFLFVFLGVVPAFTVYGLFTKKKMKSMQKLCPYKNRHWSWAFSHYLGLVLIFWINVQLLCGIGFGILHFIYTTLGVLVVLVAHLPSTLKEYASF